MAPWIPRSVTIWEEVIVRRAMATTAALMAQGAVGILVVVMGTGIQARKKMETPWRCVMWLEASARAAQLEHVMGPAPRASDAMRVGRCSQRDNKVIPC